MILDVLRAIGLRLATVGEPIGPPLTGLMVGAGPRPGDLVVYPWRDGRPGHVGILSRAPGHDGVDPASVLEARRWVGGGVYKLGAGGRNPDDGTPFDRDGRCDCSGFVAHCLGIDRKQPDGWVNTTAIVLDAQHPGGRFELVAGVVDLRRCQVIHCHGGKGPAVSESSGALWARRGVVVRFVG